MKKLNKALKNACSRYMQATITNAPEADRIKIFFEIQGIKSIIEQQ